MVEGTPLLRVQIGNGLEGSNPFLSAIHFSHAYLAEIAAKFGLAPTGSTPTSTPQYPHQYPVQNLLILARTAAFGWANSDDSLAALDSQGL